jgi:hypothetical protein
MNQEHAGQLLLQLARSRAPMSPDHLVAVDELLDNYPGIRPADVWGRRAIVLAALEGNEAVTAHLESRKGDCIRLPGCRDIDIEPVDAADAFLSIFPEDPVEAVRGYRPYAVAAVANDPDFETYERPSDLLEALTSGNKASTPVQLAAMDELLDDYPGIDAQRCGRYAFSNAAENGNLAAVSHLFSRYGECAAGWTDFWFCVPAESCILINALSERQALVETLPEAVAPVMEKPRARRL